jgi:predicted RNA-binding Zn-ribbon protein involved in translation (DUF1610 family)
MGSFDTAGFICDSCGRHLPPEEEAAEGICEYCASDMFKVCPHCRCMPGEGGEDCPLCGGE